MRKYKIKEHFNTYVEVIVKANDKDEALEKGRNKIADMYQLDGYDEDFTQQILNHICCKKLVLKGKK